MLGEGNDSLVHGSFAREPVNSSHGQLVTL